LESFKSGHWLMKNVVGNWEIAPVYTYQTGTLATVQSGVDSNLNGDTARDRTIVNPSGTLATGSGTTPLMNSAGQTAAYLVNNPNAGHIQAPEGTIATGGRDTEHLRPIDDLSISSNIRQYTGGCLTDVTPAGVSASGLPATRVTSGNVLNFLNADVAHVPESDARVFE
jgi:hypothetical protein